MAIAKDRGIISTAKFADKRMFGGQGIVILNSAKDVLWVFLLEIFSEIKVFERLKGFVFFMVSYMTKIHMETKFTLIFLVYKSIIFEIARNH